jgi:integrase/recombinase XerD
VYRRRGGVFYATVNGQRVSLRTRDPERAALEERGLGGVGGGAAAADPLVADILARWLAARRLDAASRTATIYAGHVRRLGAFLAGRTVGSLVRADLERFKAERRRAPKTVNLELGSLVAALNWAAEVGLLRHDQVPRFGRWRVKARPKAPDYVRRDEFERLLAATPAAFRVAFELGRYAGLRADEVRRLEWGDVDLGRGWLTVRGSKSGDRRVAVATVLAARLEAQRQRTRRYVVEVRPGEPWSPSGFSHAVGRTFRRAGLKAPGRGHTHHLLRATFASTFAGPIHALRDALGHAHLQTTQRYMAAVPELQREGVEGGSRR